MKRNATSPRPVSDNQIVSTPLDFIDAVKYKFGPLWCDLAALPENAKAFRYIDPETDSLAYPWPQPGQPWLAPGSVRGSIVARMPANHYCWLNPPFAEIAPWVAKAAECTTNVLVLVPASVGSRWFGEHVIDCAHWVYFLSPRLKFTKDPYPKDLMLIEYRWMTRSRVEGRTQFEQWRWK